MRLLVLVASVALGGFAAADASPLLPLASSTPAATLVAQGCGLGYSRGAYGRCRPNSFGFGVPGARRYGYGGFYGYGRPYYRPYGYGYGYRY